MKLRPHQSEPSPFRSRRPGDVAKALAAIGVSVFPTHGIASRGRDFECDCMKGRRFFAARDGVEVAKCPQPGKLPRLKGWQGAASVDVDEIDAWSRKATGGWPRANFAAPTGSANGFFVLDVDGETGRRSLTELEAEHGRLPATWAVTTGSGGLHFYFAIPDGVVIRNSQKFAPGLDVRGDGGLIIVAGSRHISGGRYAWNDGCAPDECDLASPPEWVVQFARSANKATRDGGVERAPRQARGGQGRHVTRQHVGGLYIGDGVGRAGFHNAINSRACAYFKRFGLDAPADRLIAALQAAIDRAPTDPDRPPEKVDHYRSEAYLAERIESARLFISNL